MELVVALGVLAILGLIFASLFTNTFNSLRSAELKGAKGEMRQILNRRLDCAQTLASGAPAVTSLNFSTACTGSNFFKLKDKNGALLGVWDASSNSLKVGSYSYQTTCQANPFSLVIRAARLAPNNTSSTCTGFAADPMTKKCLNWTNSENHVVEVSKGQTLCTVPTSAAATTEFVVVNEKSKCLWNGACTNEFSASKCQLGAAGSTAVHPFFVGFAYCPAGYTAIGGGGYCHFGYLAGSERVSAGNGWVVQCCGYPDDASFAYNDSVNGPLVKGGVHALCQRSADFGG